MCLLAVTLGRIKYLGILQLSFNNKSGHFTVVGEVDASNYKVH